MDAFVLGAVPPYSMLLGGKLIALAAISQEIQAVFQRRYASKQTVINARRVGPLAMITTTSALGRSSLYNRLRFAGATVFHSVGYTKGSGDFPFLNGLYDELRAFVAEHYQPTAKHDSWGSGFRNRREVVQKALLALGLPRSLLYHGVAREIFVAPLADNTAAFLRGEADELRNHHRPFGQLADYFVERWLLPRSIRDTSYRQFTPESWRIWN